MLTGLMRPCLTGFRLQGNKTNNREAVANFTASYLAAGMNSPLPSLATPRGEGLDQ